MDPHSIDPGPPPAPAAPAAPAASDEPAQVLDLVVRLGEAAADLARAEAAAVGLRPPLYALLQVAAAAGPEGLTVSQAAARLEVRPQALNQPAQELEAAGLLTRAADRADARARRLAATPLGQERLAPAVDLRRRLAEEIARQVPAASVAKLVLSRVLAALESIAPAPE